MTTRSFLLYPAAARLRVAAPTPVDGLRRFSQDIGTFINRDANANIGEGLVALYRRSPDGVGIIRVIINNGGEVVAQYEQPNRNAPWAKVWSADDSPRYTMDPVSMGIVTVDPVGTSAWPKLLDGVRQVAPLPVPAAAKTKPWPEDRSTLVGKVIVTDTKHLCSGRDQDGAKCNTYRVQVLNVTRQRLVVVPLEGPRAYEQVVLGIGGRHLLSVETPQYKCGDRVLRQWNGYLYDVIISQTSSTHYTVSKVHSGIRWMDTAASHPFPLDTILCYSNEGSREVFPECHKAQPFEARKIAA